MKAQLAGLLPDVMKGLAACDGCPVQLSSERRGLTVAGQEMVIEVLEALIGILFPGCHLRRGMTEPYGEEAMASLEEVAITLREQVRQAFAYQCLIKQCKEDCSKCDQRAVDTVSSLMRELPALLRVLHKDIQAAYEGDPAACSTMEVVMSYPGVFAVTVHRIANCLYRLEVPLIPRMMAEHAHSRTGIDIHPGATIGEGFFIDHGTGVVIGETCQIGRNVKLYQGVTLGALSFYKDEDGHLVKGIKRHPNVEDNVVIYAGATILGGKTTIGQGTTIGGNVWLTHSVPPGAKVYNQQPNPLIRQRDGRWKTKEGPWDNLGDGI